MADTQSRAHMPQLWCPIQAVTPAYLTLSPKACQFEALSGKQASSWSEVLFSLSDRWDPPATISTAQSTVPSGQKKKKQNFCCGTNHSATYLSYVFP